VGLPAAVCCSLFLFLFSGWLAGRLFVGVLVIDGGGDRIACGKRGERA
jgi:hypothetical protein